MSNLYTACPLCGHADLDPRPILIGTTAQEQRTDYREIMTLKCQQCGWHGEQDASTTNAESPPQQSPTPDSSTTEN